MQGKREKPKNPSPLSSPLRKGRGETSQSAELLDVKRSREAPFVLDMHERRIKVRSSTWPDCGQPPQPA